MNSVDVIRALRAAYAAPEWVFLEEVSTKTGVYKGRSIDGLAVSPWPSRGLALEAFEVKVERNDFLRERKNPAKADDIAGYVDRFWIVTPAGLIKEHEVPLSWGWMEVLESGKLKVRVVPGMRKPKPINRMFLASVLRNFGSNHVHRSHIEDAVKAKLEEQIRIRTSSLEHELKSLKKDVQEFEEASGIKMNGQSWRYPEIGRAIDLVLHKDVGYQARQIARIAESLKTIAEDFGKAAEELTAIDNADKANVPK